MTCRLSRLPEGLTINFYLFFGQIIPQQVPVHSVPPSLTVIAGIFYFVSFANSMISKAQQEKEQFRGADAHWPSSKGNFRWRPLLLCLLRFQ